MFGNLGMEQNQLNRQTIRRTCLHCVWCFVTVAFSGCIANSRRWIFKLAFLNALTQARALHAPVDHDLFGSFGNLWYLYLSNTSCHFQQMVLVVCPNQTRSWAIRALSWPALPAKVLRVCNEPTMAALASLCSTRWTQNVKDTPAQEQWTSGEANSGTFQVWLVFYFANSRGSMLYVSLWGFVQLGWRHFPPWLIALCKGRGIILTRWWDKSKWAPNVASTLCLQGMVWTKKVGVDTQESLCQRCPRWHCLCPHQLLSNHSNTYWNCTYKYARNLYKENDSWVWMLGQEAWVVWDVRFSATPSSKLLVFDLGGGTFDVSVMETGGGLCEAGDWMGFESVWRSDERSWTTLVDRKNI